MEPSELVQALAAETLPHDEFDYPRRKADGSAVGRVRMQLISVSKEMEARKRGLDKLKKDPRITPDVFDSQAAQDLLGDYVAHEVLAMSCLSTVNRGTDEKPHYPFLFGNPRNLEEHATRDEIDWLWQQYLVLRAKCGIWRMENVDTNEAVASWAKELEAAGTSAPLCSLASQDLVTLASRSLITVRTLSRILASQLENSEISLASELEIFMEDTTYYGESPDTGNSKPGETPGDERQSQIREDEEESPESESSVQPDARAVDKLQAFLDDDLREKRDAEGGLLSSDEAREIAKKL